MQQSTYLYNIRCTFVEKPKYHALPRFTHSYNSMTGKIKEILLLDLSEA